MSRTGSMLTADTHFPLLCLRGDGWWSCVLDHDCDAVQSVCGLSVNIGHKSNINNLSENP